jgi:ParB family chromosome partitioning protein
MQRPALDAVWRDLVIQDGEGNAEMSSFAKMNKGEKAKELEGLFNDTSVQEALGPSRALVAEIDAWVPVVLEDRWEVEP